MDGGISELRFDGEVALVTGGGRGMGRAHALLLAKRGAKVIVNDFGVTMDGQASSEGPAAAVTSEIRSLGGEAVADTNDVSLPEGAQAMVQTAIDAWGRLDIVVHNAGIVTFAPIGQMAFEQWRHVLAVHLDGAFLVVSAAWPHMVAQRHGRIILITSQAALSGLPNSAHYTAAKTALTGLARAFAMEGRTHGIQANSVDVLAYTRLMEGFFEEGAEGSEAEVRLRGAEWWRAYVRPELTSPVIAWLAHRQCPVTGQILNTTAGRVCNQFLTMTNGFTDLNLTIESIARNAGKIFDRTPGTREFADGVDYADWQFAKLSADTGIPKVPSV